MIGFHDLCDHLDELFDTPGFPDYPNALNGVQVERRGPVGRLFTAVDASERVIKEAAARGADMLVVHHGLFWDGLKPVTGRRYRKLKRLLESNIGLYSSHLPLDAHPEVGNAAVLGRRLGARLERPFGEYQGISIGWRGAMQTSPSLLQARLADLTGGPVRWVDGGSETIASVAVATGAGASFLEEAARSGIDALVTGEGPHHSVIDARELGVHLFLAGHYATETWGVRAVGERLARTFDLEWSFVDDPSGL